MDATAPTVLPESPIGKAIGYARRQWGALNVFVDHGFLGIDNNPAERVLRPVVVGRKNWMFMGSDRGGRNAAVIFSLVESCRRSDVNCFEYFRDVLVAVSTHPASRIDELTPLGWKTARDARSGPGDETAADA